MGILDSLKKGLDALKKKTSDLLCEAKDKIRRNADFQKELKSFKDSLNCLESSLTSFYDSIGEKPNNLESFYNEIVKNYPNKYTAEKSRYLNLISRIQDHDAKIKKVDSLIKPFSCQKIISNPSGFSLSSFNQYDEAATILESCKNFV